MARQLRIQYEGAHYHAMNRGLNRQAIFLDDRDREVFLGLIAKTSERFNLLIHGYALMGNHFHLHVATPDANLDRCMRHLTGVYTQRFNYRHGRDGPLFRGRYRSKLVETDGHLTILARYVALNPVAAGLVRNPIAWEWSSYRPYVDRRLAPEWLQTALVLSLFDDRVSAFRRYVESGLPSDDRLFASDSPIIGAEDFVSTQLDQTSVDRETRTSASLAQIRPSVDAINSAVARAFGVGPETLREGRQGQVNPARTAAVAIARRATDLTGRELAVRYGYANYSSVSSALTRFEQMMEGRSGFSHRVDDVLANLQLPSAARPQF